MRAVFPSRGGGVEIQELPRPVPGAGEVLVRIRAAGMNRADLLHAKGSYQQRVRGDLPNTAGMELAGTVVEVGPGADPQWVDSEVAALFPGGFAEYQVVDQRLLFAAPPALTWAERGALPMGLFTEAEALIGLACLKPGDSVLVTGASSGVAHIGVQLAAALGLEVYATTRNAERTNELRELGATHVVLPHQLDELAPDSIHGVIDHVGGAQARSGVRLLAAGGALVSVGRLGGKVVELDLAALSAKRGRIIGTTWKSRSRDEVACVVADLFPRISSLVAEGKVRPRIAGTFHLGEVHRAYAALEGHGDLGKLVLRMGGDA